MAFKLFGLKGSYGLLYLVVPYYLLFDRKAVVSARPYIKHRFPNSGFLDLYKHAFFIFLNVGKHLIDRYVYLTNERHFNVSLKEGNKILNLLSSNRNKGLIILTSHIGNWQLAVNTLKHFNSPVHIVMRPEQNPAVQESLKLYTDRDNIKIISPSEQNMGGIIEIMSALKNGHIVAITGDRSYGTETINIVFMGAAANFPYTAFKIAAETECPIAILLTHKISETEYQVDLCNLLYPQYSNRKNKVEQLKQYVQKYADIISTFMDEHPYDCFIFRDIWN